MIKTLNFEPGTLNWRRIAVSLLLLAASCGAASAQIQQAWVTRYNNGITNGAHQALKMAVGADGNIYVCGFSQNANSNLDYAVLKYAPNGHLLWVARFDSTNTPQAKPAGFALDSNNNALVTGNAGTVKFDSGGVGAWWQPYSGTSVAADSDENVFVTGFGSSFNTVKLSPAGTNLWTQTYTDVGPTVGESIAIDSSGDSYVAGLDTYYVYRNVSEDGLFVAKYSPGGSLLWQFIDRGGTGYVIRVSASLLDEAGDYYVLFDDSDPGSYTVDRLNPDGTQTWRLANPGNTSGISHSLSLATNSVLAMSGEIVDQSYATYGIGPNGACIWTDYYPGPPFYPPKPAAGANAMCPGNSAFYVTGFYPGANTGNDIVTIAYDTNGKQLWLQRYDGPAHGDDEGNAIAVDTNGNVYVAGYDTPIGGGTEMVLIKYSPVTGKHEANGDFQLQAEGGASEPFDIQASTNLATWQDLGDFDADTNGLLQFTDTNAGLFSSRFYLAIPR